MNYRIASRLSRHVTLEIVLHTCCISFCNAQYFVRKNGGYSDDNFRGGER